MSLAASGGGMAGGGMAGGGMAMSMAHTGPAAMAKHVGRAPPGAAAGGGSGTSGIRSASGLAADLVDKSLSNKAVRNTKRLPIVCVDLYGDDGEVSYAPPGEDQPVLSVGSVGTSLTLKRNNEAGYKALRKMLSNAGEVGEGFYHQVLTTSLVDFIPTTTTTTTNDADNDTVTLTRPHLLLGARRLSAVRPQIRDRYPYSPEDLDDAETSKVSAAIRPVDHTLLSDKGVVLHNGSLSAEVQHDDYDRVDFRLDLLPKKKPLTVLPEEAVSLLLAKAKHIVSQDVHMKTRYNTSSSKEAKEEDEEYLAYPMALAVPGWHAGDATVEAHLESTLQGTGSALVYHRTVCAVAGALLPSPSHNTASSPNNVNVNRLLQLVHTAAAATHKRLEKELNVINAANNTSDPLVIGEDTWPLLLAVGVTQEGVEGVACQLHQPQEAANAPLGQMKVLSEVGYLCDTAKDGGDATVRKVLDFLLDSDLLPPDNRTPLAVLTFGTASSQEKLKKTLTKHFKKREHAEVVTTTDLADSVVMVDKAAGTPSILATKPEAVAVGACALAAGAHGRITDGRSDKKILTSVKNVSACAVGVRMTYGDGSRGSSDVKVVFDFDRRVPAGPYEMELTAAQCAAVRGSDGGTVDEETVAHYTGGGKNIRLRETAALAFRMQVVQKLDRDGAWTDVGDVMEPLVMVTEDDTATSGEDGGENVAKTKTAVETCNFNISVSASGLISMQLTSDNKSITQALKSGRWSTLRYYLLIIFFVCFLGGFLVKSYVEDVVFDRDVTRLLEYYKHVTPNTMNDGDRQRARYLVYKYRNKKAKLWKNLEFKYGTPVPEFWPEEEEEEVIDMDDDEDKKQNEDGDSDTTKEPDL